VYICPLELNNNNRALHFLVDLGLHNFLLDTKVGFILHHISTDCNNPKDMPEKEKFNFNLIVLRQGAKNQADLPILGEYLENKDPNKGPFKQDSPLLMDIPIDRSSFFNYLLLFKDMQFDIKLIIFLIIANILQLECLIILKESNFLYDNGIIVNNIPLYDVSKTIQCFLRR